MAEQIGNWRARATAARRRLFLVHQQGGHVNGLCLSLRSPSPGPVGLSLHPGRFKLVLLATHADRAFENARLETWCRRLAAQPHQKPVEHCATRADDVQITQMGNWHTHETTARERFFNSINKGTTLTDFTFRCDPLRLALRAFPGAQENSKPPLLSTRTESALENTRRTPRAFLTGAWRSPLTSQPRQKPLEHHAARQTASRHRLSPRAPR